jgi:uncharacterized alkaline shock family protein YloU
MGEDRQGKRAPRRQAPGRGEPAGRQSAGKVDVSADVVAVLARETALGVDGVEGVCATLKGMVRGALGTAVPGVEARFSDDGGVVLDLHVAARYGRPLSALADDVVSTVRQRVRAVTGSPSVEVIVHFDEIHRES